MSETNESVAVPDTSPTPPETKSRKEKKSRNVKKVNPDSMWSDPVVAFMGIMIFSLIVGALAFIVIALSRSYIGTTVPKTASAAALVTSKQDTEKYPNDPKIYKVYVMQLIENRQYAFAQQKIDEGLKRFAKTDTYDRYMLNAQAYLYAAKGEDAQAIKAAIAAQVAMKQDYKELLKSDQQPNKATAYGLSDNYSAMQLLLGGIYYTQGKYPASIKQLKAYLSDFDNITEAGVWTDLGNSYAKNGDKELARKAYNTTLKYEPDNAEAKAALAKLGAK